PLGEGGRGRGAGGVGPAPTTPAAPAPDGTGARAGREPGRPGPGPPPRRRLTPAACQGGFHPCCWWPDAVSLPGVGRDGHSTQTSTVLWSASSSTSTSFP